MRFLPIPVVLSLLAGPGAAREHGSPQAHLPPFRAAPSCICLQVCALQQGQEAGRQALPRGCRRLPDRVLYDRMAGCRCTGGQPGHQGPDGEKGR